MPNPMTFTIRVSLRSYSTYWLSRITYLIAQLVSLADHLTIRVMIMALRTFFPYHYATPRLTTDCPACLASPARPRPLVRSTDCASIVYSVSFQNHRFTTVDILNAPFHPYCLDCNTLDSLPIRLVVDRPLWTSSVYI